MAKNPVQKQIRRYCEKAVIRAIEEPLVVGEQELDLPQLFDEGIGKKRWPAIMRRQVGLVQRTVENDVKAGRVDPMTASKPFRFVVNSVSIHVLEKLLVKAGIADSIGAVREDGYHEALHDRVGSLELKS